MLGFDVARPPVVPFYPFFGGGFPLLKQTTEKGYPYSNLSTGGPRLTCRGVNVLFRHSDFDLVSEKFEVRHARASSRLCGAVQALPKVGGVAAWLERPNPIDLLKPMSNSMCWWICRQGFEG